MLLTMGADVRGAGSDRHRDPRRRDSARRAPRVAGDRIEAGTLLAAALATRGDVRVSGVDPAMLESTLDKFREGGAEIEIDPTSVRLRQEGRLQRTRIVTAPFPGFPTDMQAQLMAVLTLATGASVVTESVFENRFMHVPELLRMGADIALAGRTAHVNGVRRLSGAPVMATDLRASAGLIVAALAAEGDTW